MEQLLIRPTETGDKGITAPFIFTAPHKHEDGPPKPDHAAATAREVDAHNLPGLFLDLSHKSQQERHWYTGALAVGKDLVKGSYHELRDHPLHVLECAAIGAGTAAVATLLSPVELGLLTGAGIAYSGYQLYKHVPGWIHSAEAVANPESHSMGEVIAAHRDLEGVGAGATDIAAGIAGGVAYRYASPAIKAAWARTSENHVVKTTATTSGVTDQGDPNAHAQIVQSTANSQPDGGHTVRAISANGDNGAGAHHTAISGQLSPDQGSDAVKPKIAMVRPEAAAPELTVEGSIKNTQGIFANAKDNDGVVEATKQLYKVHFEKVTEEAGRKVITLENRHEGEMVKAGQWIATRLDGNGQPVIEDGIPNRWAMDASKIAKTYNVDAAKLEAATNLIAPTRIDAPAVHMVQLREPITIKTSWGDMKGAIGDWLANYDYDVAAGAPGKSYAIISKTSFGQTYQIKP